VCGRGRFRLLGFLFACERVQVTDEERNTEQTKICAGATPPVTGKKIKIAHRLVLFCFAPRNPSKAPAPVDFNFGKPGKCPLGRVGVLRR
jgi:hypothetical protein